MVRNRVMVLGLRGYRVRVIWLGFMVIPTCKWMLSGRGWDRNLSK